MNCKIFNILSRKWIFLLHKLCNNFDFIFIDWQEKFLFFGEMIKKNTRKEKKKKTTIKIVTIQS